VGETLWPRRGNHSGPTWGKRFGPGGGMVLALDKEEPHRPKLTSPEGMALPPDDSRTMKVPLRYRSNNPAKEPTALLPYRAQITIARTTSSSFPQSAGLSYPMPSPRCDRNTRPMLVRGADPTRLGDIPHPSLRSQAYPPLGQKSCGWIT